MKKGKNNRHPLFSWSALMLAMTFIFMTGFEMNNTTINPITSTTNIDINDDGTLNILIIGTNSSISGAEAFSPDQIANELQQILAADASIITAVNVVPEDIHMSKSIIVGLGQSGNEYTWTHHSHSLAQYYYWPEGLENRMDHLSGNGDIDWDYVIIGADPYILSTTPGYYSLGVNKVAAKVAEGDAQALLLMMWPKNESSITTIDHFEEFTYRTSDGANVELATIPAGLAWASLPDELKDEAIEHPTPNGAYLAAASIYSQLCGTSAATSEYFYDNELAEAALSSVIEEENQVHYTGIRTFMSPFKSCDIGDEVLNYNHTGTSSENGILGGLNWVFNQAPETLQNGGTSPINFNYGRANSNFEANKRYKIDSALFDFSFGFPMQDHGNNGNESMLYGLDIRQSGTINDTDLGVAQFMIDQSELPYARAIPVRTLYAQMKEAIPGQSAYGDSWHMNGDLNKAIGAYMFTLLTGQCAIGEEPADQETSQWRSWKSHNIGYETAWNLMYLEGNAPNCSDLVDLDGDGFTSYVDCNDEDININPGQTETPYNGINDDCNAATFDDDFDQDGFLAADDCDDTAANINPNQVETPYNGIDDDCNAATFDDDLDQDGFLLADDCDDTSADINPNQVETPYNGIDDDCNAATLDDDLDQDGFILADDCDDTSADINPNQVETPYNGIDDDCNASTLDDDLDQDGFILADDCDDTSADINPNQVETPYNGIDDDCNASTLDDDLDQDGFLLADDCDDTIADINPNQVETPYNGTDDDCNAATLDDDLDQDGFLFADDCDDDNASINPDAAEIANNGIDEDCDDMDVTTSIHELSNATIKIYPNPVSDRLNIMVEGQLQYKTTLYNIEGKIIATSRNTSKIKINHLTKGIYLLEIQEITTGKRIGEKIIKE